MNKSDEKKNNLSPHEASLRLYDDFISGAHIDRFQKLLVRYELFKMTLDVPGDIVECGVFKGSGLYTWAKLQKIFRPHTTQKIVGFDFFETDRSMSFEQEQDKTCLDWHSDSSRWSPREKILNNMERFDIKNVELVAGNVIKTTKEYSAANLGFRISLLYLDVDNYEGTMAALEHLYPHVVRGGIIALDEYALRTYGESDAVDKFFEKTKCRPRALPWGSTPTAYIVKE